jgi:hypothetical protein
MVLRSMASRSTAFAYVGTRSGQRKSSKDDLMTDVSILRRLRSEGLSTSNGSFALVGP